MTLGRDRGALPHVPRTVTDARPELLTGDRESEQALADSPLFVGRVDELAQGQRLLADGARLVTLTGPGGVGKTRLARELADVVRHAIRDGVWFVDLGNLREDLNGELVVQALISALGLRDQSPEPCPLAALKRYLRDRRALVVLDNCEHLVDVCAPIVGDVLRAAGALQIVTTSRRPFQVSGEHILTIPPLPLPNPALPVERLLQSPAVRLFVDRAAAAAPGWRLTEANGAAVARLCERLEGLPLAIELAAARVMAVPIEQIGRKLDVTTGEHAELLRALVDWSYDLCSEKTRTLWQRMSVFPGEFDIAAAEAICTGGSIAREDVLLLVADLIDHSLLQRVQDSTPARYRMLRPVRDYGNDRLTDAERTCFMQRHLDYFHAMSLQVEPESCDCRQRAWLRRMTNELANLRGALEYALSSPGQARAGLETAASIAEFWIFLGRLGEARHWLMRAIRQEPQPSVARARAMSVAAWIALQQGDTAAAATLLETCTAEACGDEGELARVRGVVAFYRGDARGAIALLEQALDRCRMGAERPANAFLALLFRTASAVFARDDRVTRFSAECLARAAATGAEWWMGWALWAAGLERWSQGDLSAAAGRLREALRRLHDLDDRWGPLWCVEALAWVAGDAGKFEDSAFLLGAARAYRTSIRVSMEGIRPFATANDRCHALSRGAMGSQAFDDAFGCGGRCTLDEAITYALDDRWRWPGAEAPAPGALMG